MPSPPLRGALIGCGFVSRHHLEGWARVPGARLVALCDRDAARLEHARPYWPEADPFPDAAQLFEEVPLDFVEICTGPESHRALVELAARHGVHVLCQKPAAPGPDDFHAMIAACTNAGVRLMIHENWRFRPWYRALRAELDAGTIGRPIRLRIAHHDTRALRPGGYDSQPYLATMTRLILTDMGCHLVDTARYLMGEIQSVTATAGRFGARSLGEDVATICVRFESGGLGVLDFSWCEPPDPARARLDWALNDTAVSGTDGALRLQTDGSLLFVGLDGRTERRRVELPPEEDVYLQGYVATQAHFLEGLVHGREHETQATDNLRTMEAVWAAYQSIEDGRAVTFFTQGA
ncbi:MAG: Gfo/Idh/MocA family oxidoreductase [Isosphaeraceae bacterium]|nr:Gfo/Idh/MocA family oxidoreductase [Isosphaeraceae bacterium]